MQFDHLMHWVPDLDAATRAYQGLGFTIQPGGEHPGVGTRNAAWRIDARYVELITVHDEGVARAGFGPAWPAIDANLRAGGGGLAFAILVSDVTATVAELRARGVSVEDAQAGSLQQPDGSTVTWALAFLSEGPAWAPFLINYGVSVEEWSARFRGRDSRSIRGLWTTWSWRPQTLQQAQAGWRASSDSPSRRAARALLGCHCPDARSRSRTVPRTGLRGWPWPALTHPLAR
jgi:catechol 2,3-dioxygenase-like lactoylglutathione lyase family enzyme